MMRYNPEQPPQQQRWQALDEAEQIELVRMWHRKNRIRLPNERLHAVLHVVVENQVALGDETPVAEALERLVEEGLSRHEALHAIGGVLAAHLLKMHAGGVPEGEDANLQYFQEVRALTAQRWRQSAMDL